MKLLVEGFSDIQTTLVEDENGEKGIFIEGIFAQAELKNRNGRVYPLTIMEREALKIAKRIAENDTQAQLMGLDHPADRSELNLQEACAKVLSYKQDPSNPNNFIGKARIMESTQHGMTASGLLKEGFKLGISTRALGSVKESSERGAMVVQDDLSMVSSDLVSNPSALDAWAESTISESHKEFYLDSEGVLCEDVKATYANKIRSLKKEELAEGILKIWKEYLGTSFKDVDTRF